MVVTAGSEKKKKKKKKKKKMREREDHQTAMERERRERKEREREREREKKEREENWTDTWEGLSVTGAAGRVRQRFQPWQWVVIREACLKEHVQPCKDPVCICSFQ